MALKMQYYKSASINFKLFIINIIRIKNCKTNTLITQHILTTNHEKSI